MSRANRTITRCSRHPRTISNDLYDCPTVSHRSRRIASSFRTRAINGHDKRCKKSIRFITRLESNYIQYYKNQYSFSHLVRKY
jgi:hypothetical protein